MKILAAISTVLAATGFASSAQAQRQDWRACAVMICSKGECDGPNSNLIVVAPANFADPGFGGEAAMMQQLEALSERLYPVAQGWAHQPECLHKPDESTAMEQAKAYIALAKMEPASREIKIANPNEVWKYSESAAAVSKATPEPQVAKTEPQRTELPKTGSGGGEPMHFLLYVGLREPIGGVNANCFSNVITLPAPEGYRGQWPTLKNALPIIQSYFPAFQAECSKRGTVYGAVGFMTDDTSPSQAMIKMNATVGEWRGYRFPEVYIAK